MTLGEYSVRGTTSLFPNLCPPISIFLFFSFSVGVVLCSGEGRARRDGQDILHLLPSGDADPSAQHVDRHDGQHLRHCQREVGEGVPQAVGKGHHEHGEVIKRSIRKMINYYSLLFKLSFA